MNLSHINCKGHLVPVFVMVLVQVVLGSYGTIHDYAYGISPSFVRQELKDEGLYSWNYINFNNSGFQNYSIVTSDMINSLVNASIGDIDSVSYISNGKLLNVTFWLTAPFQERPIKNIPNFIVTINADSNLFTGTDKGFDYRAIIKWDNLTKSWQKIFQETSPSGNIRLLDLENNYTGFFSKNDTRPEYVNINSYYPNPCCYVTVPIDLDLINYPQQYVVHFAIINSLYDKEMKPVFVGDSTDQVAIPPSQFFILPEQNSFEMRAGEEKKVRLELNSTSFLPTIANLSVISADPTEDISLEITPDRIYIQPNDIATSLLRINSSTNTETGPYTFTISANVSLPQVNEKNQYSFESVTPSLFAQSNVITTIRNPLTFSEQFSAFWDVYGGAIGLIGGGFIGGFSGYMFARLEKKDKKR